MKKLLTIALLFLSLASYSQRAGRIFTGSTAPVGRYQNYQLGIDIFCDTVAKKYYVSKVADSWQLAPGYGSGTGGGGLNSFSIGTVTTGAAGSAAAATLTGTLTDPILNLTLPRGAKGTTGAQGPAGTPGSNSGWTDNLFTSPDKYGAAHANTTFAGAGYNQTQVDSGWGAAGALTKDTIDWAAWQMAMIEACSYGKCIQPYGDYYVNKSIQMSKYFRSLTIQGNKANIITVNTSPFTVIGRPSPTDNTDALNLMVSSVLTVTDLIIRPQTENDNQVGFEPGPNENSRFTGIWVTSMRTGVHLRFSLNTIVDLGQAFYCDSGFVADMGNWPGASASNSQSNATTFDHCRVYCRTLSTLGFGIFGASGCEVKNCIVEGFNCVNGIKYDALGSVNVYNFWVSNLHFECVNAATGNNAAIKVRGLGGEFKLNGAYGQYPAVLLDIESTISSYNVVVEQVYSWVPASGRRYWRSRGTNQSWLFIWNDQLAIDGDDIKNTFATDAGTGGTVGVALNRRALGSEGTGFGYEAIMKCKP